MKKPDGQTDDFLDKCPGNEQGHVPDLETLEVTSDGGVFYIDVACKHCTRVGTFGSVEFLTRNMTW
jgi:hypothetical protein